MKIKSHVLSCAFSVVAWIIRQGNEREENNARVYTFRLDLKHARSATKKKKKRIVEPPRSRRE